MELSEIVQRTAWRAGAGEDEADRLVEAFLHEVREAIAGGGSLKLGTLGTFHGVRFTPGPALAEPVAATLSETAGYEEGTAPSDS